MFRQNMSGSKAPSRGSVLSGLLHFREETNGLGIKIWWECLGSPFGDTGKYYLHLYDQTQADLNWRNQAVKERNYSK